MVRMTHGVICKYMDWAALSAYRYVRLRVARFGPGHWTRIAVLHWQRSRHHSWDHDQWIKQTSYIQP